MLDLVRRNGREGLFTVLIRIAAVGVALTV